MKKLVFAFALAIVAAAIAQSALGQCGGKCGCKPAATNDVAKAASAAK